MMKTIRFICKHGLLAWFRWKLSPKHQHTISFKLEMTPESDPPAWSYSEPLPPSVIASIVEEEFKKYIADRQKHEAGGFVPPTETEKPANTKTYVDENGNLIER